MKRKIDWSVVLAVGFGLPIFLFIASPIIVCLTKLTVELLFNAIDWEPWNE